LLPYFCVDVDIPCKRSPYGKYLRDNYPTRTITLRGQKYNSTELYDKLQHAINDVYDTVVYGKSKRRNSRDPNQLVDELFNNPFGVVDGPCYAFLVHGRGPAVNDFTEDFNENDSETSSNAIIRNNDIRNIKCWTKEVPGKFNTFAQTPLFHYCVHSEFNFPILPGVTTSKS